MPAGGRRLTEAPPFSLVRSRGRNTVRLVDIVALTGNVAVALHGVENHLEHAEVGRETPALDAAVADIRGLSAALAKVLPDRNEACVLAGSIEQIRFRLQTLPPEERHDCEVRILLALALAVKGFADLIEVLHDLSLEVQVNADPDRNCHIKENAASL